MTEAWRRVPEPVQDLLFAALFAAAWFGAFEYLRAGDWNPRYPETYVLAGWWSAAAVAARRSLPLAGFAAAALAYPLLYGPYLQTEFHLLPVLLAGYAVVAGGRLHVVPAALVAAGSVFYLSVRNLVGNIGIDVGIEWDRVLVNEFATVCTVFVGALMHRQRADAAVLATRNAELERLRQVEADQAVVAERTRIARELHDVVAHHLTAVIVRAQAADRVAATRPEVGQETLRWVVDTARDALTSVRQTVQVLRTDEGGPAYAPGPSLAELPSIVERMRAAGLAVQLQVAPDLPKLGSQAELAGVRITQEALTNTLRHSGARHARVRVRPAEDGVLLVIEDDGRGHAAPGARSPGGGHGLIGMRERATSCGGRLELGPGPRGGWTVRAWLPAAETTEELA